MAFLSAVTALWNFADLLRRLRFAISNCGYICAVTLNHVENVQSGSVRSVVDVVGNPKLNCLGPAFKRLHNFGQSIVDYICLGVEKLLNGVDGVDLVRLDISFELELIHLLESNDLSTD
jgi:hypothetical protein